MRAHKQLRQLQHASRHKQKTQHTLYAPLDNLADAHLKCEGLPTLVAAVKLNTIALKPAGVVSLDPSTLRRTQRQSKRGACVVCQRDTEVRNVLADHYYRMHTQTCSRESLYRRANTTLSLTFTGAGPVPSSVSTHCADKGGKKGQYKHKALLAIADHCTSNLTTSAPHHQSVLGCAHLAPS